MALAFVVALVGLAVQLSPWQHERMSRWIAGLCYVAAAEILLALIVTDDQVYYAAVPVGIALWIAYGVRLWQREAITRSDKPQRPVAERPRVGLVVADDSEDIRIDKSEGFGVPSLADVRRSKKVRVSNSRLWVASKAADADCGPAHFARRRYFWSTWRRSFGQRRSKNDQR